eukprot:COSAG02_NODE_8933_length_2394_cov_7.778214_7_plen_46_part_01
MDIPALGRDSVIFESSLLGLRVLPDSFSMFRLVAMQAAHPLHGQRS